MGQNNLSDNLTHWNYISRYSQWMFNQYKSFIGKRILDIGAGIGNMTQYYIKDKECVVATEIFQNQVDSMCQRFSKIPYFTGMLLNIYDKSTDMTSYRFDTIVCINVLEHLEDDFAALEKMADFLGKDGGNIIILVPAFQKLYNFMDKNVYHCRRYNRGDLIQLAQRTNLEVVKNTYFNFWGIVPYWLKGKLSKNKSGSFSTSLNENNSKVYNIATVFLEPIEKFFSPCAGISELIILSKPPENKC